MNYKLIGVGIVFFLVGFALFLWSLTFPPELAVSQSWCSTVNHVESNFNPPMTVILCCYAIGIVFVVMGIWYDTGEKKPRKDHAALLTTPRWVLREMVSYDFDPKKDPPVDNIVYRYKDKEYVFKIASIEVRDARE